VSVRFRPTAPFFLQSRFFTLKTPFCIILKQFVIKSSSIVGLTSLYYEEPRLSSPSQELEKMKFESIKSAIAIAVSCFLTAPLLAQDSNFHIYIGFGQSNMAGAGTIETQDQTVNSRFQMMAPQDCSSPSRTLGKWYTAVPPLWGCTGGLGPCDYFGRTMVTKEQTTIKIGVIVVGIPGCDIRLFDKTNNKGLEAYTYNYIPSQYNSSAYAWVIDLAKKAQKDGVIKGFLMHQGETMPDSMKWCGRVKAVYDSLISDLKLDPTKTPLLAGELLYKSAGGSEGDHNIFVDSLPKFIPNCYVISASGLAGKDQYHFNSASERTFGARYADKMFSLESSVANKENEIASNHMRKSVVFDGGVVRANIQGPFSYTITNVSGKQVLSGKGTGSFSLSVNLVPGVYFLTVNNSRVFFQKKFVTTQVSGR